MADTEFEELRQNLDALPSFRKAPAPFYSLVADVDLDDSPSSKSDASSDHEEDGPLSTSDGTVESVLKGTPSKTQQIIQTISTISSSSSTGEDDEIGDGLRTVTLGPRKSSLVTDAEEDLIVVSSGGSGPESLLQLHLTSHGHTVTAGESKSTTLGPSNVGASNLVHGPVAGAAAGDGTSTNSSSQLARTSSLPWIPGQVERRRRKLPEIPKNRKSSVLQLLAGQTSLADELSASNRKPHYPTGASGHPGANFFKQSSLLALKCSYLLDEDSSPDSERLQSLGDVDSGHSTAHSPNDYKSMSPPPPQAASPVTSPFPPPYGGVPYSQLEMLEATHRALHKFIPRHHDEIEIEIGDPIYVQKEAEDLWCEGVNLRTGRQGIFPSAYAVDLDYNDFDPTSIEMKRERYLLGYLGSVETMAHKGTGVVCQAVRKIVGNGTESPKAQPCILEISDQGLRMVDRSRNKKSKGPCIDYFYSLKNVSFCAFHPRDHRYIGFITKHPTVQRFACHVFQGTESTRPVAEAVGRAFQRFYQKFIETAYPIEDIYID
ncbi:JNK-interacting protein 1 [Anopheles stephensi]|uniref:JNK-interacting protein 1 n=1 Tax=Anopheles stephensi TaxID=30069 RepID=UPI001658ACD5|nr:JNK-interacting protein 1 [Anopheles stephensi]XP_035907375.1 JNK-interacting protein 1 [Anopheles stephensi]